jgi:hypothetical protein
LIKYGKDKPNKSGDHQMEHHSGGCQCGKIRFHIVGPMGQADICHCRMCQKAFGSWGAALLRVQLKDLKWTRGEPAVFNSSPSVERGFCNACGTPISMFEEGDDFVDLAIGTLDHPNAVHLTSQIGIESKLKWFDTMHSLPSHDTQEDRKKSPPIVSLQHPDFDTPKWPVSQT